MAASPALKMRYLLPILAAACWAGEGEAVRVQLAATSALETHWNASVLGRVLAETPATPLSARWSSWLTGLQGGAQAARAFQLDLVGLDARGQPRWAVQADLGTQAPQVARRIAATYRFPRPLPVPAADEAWQLDGLVLARFGGIVAFGRPAELLPLAPSASTADISVDIGIPALLGFVRRGLGSDSDAVGALFDLVSARWRSLSVRADLTAEGVSWHGALHGDPAGLRAVDRSVLAGLPATATLVVLLGIDGPRLWRSSGEGLLPAVAGLLYGAGPEGIAASRAAVEELMPGPSGLRQVIEACDGTIAVLQTPGVPYPGFSIVLPRRAELDRLLSRLCGRYGALAPADGGSALLAAPDLPMPLLVARGRTRWLITSDTQLAADWGMDGPGGFAGTRMGLELQRRTPAAACMLIACDTGAEVRALMGLINQALVPNRDLSQIEKQAALTTCARLSAVLTPAYQWAVAASDRLDLTGEGGDLTWITLPALAGAWTLPDWIENGGNAAESAAMATLKSILFPAEVQFQAGCFMDQDGDGVGEYGLISELSGRRPAGKAAAGGVHLVQGPLVMAEISNSYHFAAYLPDGLGGAISEPDGLLPRVSMVGPGRAADADEQEGHFVIYAWPTESEAGQRLFAIDQSGQVRERLWDGQAPVWNSLYDGGSWADEAAWPVVKRGARRR